ncbi:hypothetical protein CDD83_2577 [Cordyceps sp. RAO-2017]|nr:hypothetical protein CDD83_2577 [Cordyceps sp. RAO-2017]
MAVHPTDAAVEGMGVHGLRFLNDEWNDSISNGAAFTVRWNQSLAKAGSGLGVFKVTYPKDGVVVYELVSNLTDAIDGDGESCKWTPQNLDKKDLYAMWLTSGTSGEDTQSNWTLSPPWIPKEPTGQSSNTWAAPFIIPVVCLLGLYAACLTGYLVYRRRKKARREKEDATPHQDVSRNNSVASAATSPTIVAADDATGKRGRTAAPSIHSGTDVTVVSGAAGGVPDDFFDVERSPVDGHSDRPDRSNRRGIRLVNSSASGSEVTLHSAREADVADADKDVEKGEKSVPNSPNGRNFSRPVQKSAGRGIA